MAQHQPSPQDLQTIRDFAAQWGKIIARRAFGDAGPGTTVDFQTMEEVARAAAAGLSEGTLTVLLQHQADALGVEHACPECGRRCTMRLEDRTMIYHGGQVTHREPRCHCPDCRRDFFPPTARAASGQPRLQSHRAADDR